VKQNGDGNGKAPAEEGNGKVKKKVKETAKKVKEKAVEKKENIENQIAGISDKVKSTMEALPEKSKEFVTNPEQRSKTLKSVGGKLKNASKSFGKKIVKDFVHEVKEAGSGVKKVLKGELPSKDEAKAMATLAVEVGAAAALTVSGAGVIAGAGYLGKSMVKHAVLSAINPIFGNMYILDKAVDLAMKFAAEKKELTDEEVTAVIVKAVMDAVGEKFEQGMTNEEVMQALRGEFPKIDLTKMEISPDGKSKKARSVVARGEFGKSEFLDSGRRYVLTVDFDLDDDHELSEKDVFDLLRSNWNDVKNKAKEKWWDGDRMLKKGDGTVKTLNIKDVRGFDFDQKGDKLTVEKEWKAKELDSRKKLRGEVTSADIRYVEKGDEKIVKYRFALLFNRNVDERTVRSWLIQVGWSSVIYKLPSADVRSVPEGFVDPINTEGVMGYPYEMKELPANRWLVETEMSSKRFPERLKRARR
jgi:hypothetical protein